MQATCQTCRRLVTWAALEGETIAFEVAVLQDEGPVYELHKAHGTWRARDRRATPSYTTPYRRHTCRKDAPQQ
jgi:hypothetical protein